MESIRLGETQATREQLRSPLTIRPSMMAPNNCVISADFPCDQSQVA